MSDPVKKKNNLRQRIQQGGPFSLCFHVFSHWPIGTKWPLNTLSRPWRYRPITELQLTKAIWLVGNLSSQSEYIQMKKDDLAESSVLSMRPMLHGSSTLVSLNQYCDLTWDGGLVYGVGCELGEGDGALGHILPVLQHMKVLGHWRKHSFFLSFGGLFVYLFINLFTPMKIIQSVNR